MSDDSSPAETEPLDTKALTAGGTDLSDMVLRFATHDSPHFHAEFVEVGSDIVYHFWPPEEEEKFADEEFAKHLEGGFKRVLPSTADVHAAYTDFEEASLRMKEGVGLVPQKDVDKPLVKARETFFVKVIGGTEYPLYEQFLKQRVFDAIDTEINGSP